jgi:pre-rRNA-processing protein TSR3
MRAQVLMYRQDDPAKCTAAKLVRFGLAESVRFIRPNTLVLDPFSKIVLSNHDRSLFKSVCALDCSWEKARDTLPKLRTVKNGICRRLPVLLAGNPNNFCKLSKLTTAEALAASLFILGWRNLSEKILGKFKWGHTFFELNSEILNDYSKALSITEIVELENMYFPYLTQLRTQTFS